MRYGIVKNKILSFITSFIMLVCLAPVFSVENVDAANGSIKSGDFIYQVLDDGKSVQIVDYNGQSLYVSIPSKIEGYTVVSIGAAAFRSNEKVKEVEISNTVKSISANAFENCTSLEKIQIPGNVETIEESAFANCTSLVDVSLFDGIVSIESYAFSGCINLKSIVVPNSVDVIGDYVFLNCSALADVSIPKALEKFGGYVLEGTQWLKNQRQDYIIVGDGILIKYIGDSEVESLPTQVKKIGNYAFAENKTIKTILIPSSVTSIENSAFENCNSLSYVDMPGSVISIGERAFYGCTSLVEVMLPTSITKIRNETFANCISLKMIIIPAQITIIGSNAFENCFALESVKLQSGLQEIESGAFQNCISIQYMIFPETLKSINTNAFAGCNSLTRIEFNGDTYLDILSFRDCVNLTEAVFYKNLTFMPSGSAFNKSPELVIYSDNNYSLDKYADENVYAHDNIKSLDKYESKGIIEVSRNNENSFFSRDYTMIVGLIILIDIATVILFSIYIIKFPEKKRKRKSCNKTLGKNKSVITKI